MNDVGAAGEARREEITRRRGDRSLILLNVLSAEAFAAGHIPGSIHLPVAEIATRARELLPDLDADIVVYCGSAT